MIVDHFEGFEGPIRQNRDVLKPNRAWSAKILVGLRTGQVDLMA